jgi:ring-1,2-phenylacetyl-CoA epoxidase subunit PaaE
MIFHFLKIKAVVPNTKKSVLVSFDVPHTLQSTYSFKPGQHVCLDFFLERNNYRRTYSIYSAPADNQLSICVKRQHLGIISNYINDAFFKGLPVNVSQPFGDFFNEAQLHNCKAIYLWAGGSGITPLLSIAKYVLLKHSNIHVNLVYANQDLQSIILLDEIEQLESAYVNQFKVMHVLSAANNENMTEKLFAKKRKVLNYKQGVITADYIKQIVKVNGLHYLCGPQGMMALCKNTLQQLNINDHDIKVEHFAGSNTIAKANINATIVVNINGTKTQVPSTGKSLLDAMLANNIKPPYACQAGTCGTCKATLVNGEVVMSRDFALNEADRSSNKILCCQAWAKSDIVEIKY